MKINGKQYKVKYTKTSKSGIVYVTDYHTVYYKENNEWILLKSIATKNFCIMEIVYDEKWCEEFDTDLKDTAQNRAFLCKQTIDNCINYEE